MATKGRRAAILGIMWAAALVAVGFLVRYQQTARNRVSSVPRPEAPVREPSDRTDVARMDAGHSRAPPPQGPARTFRGDRRHTGRSAYAGPADPTRAWRFETGDRITGQAVIGPAGRLYVGSHDQHLYVLEASGHLVWKKDVQGAVYGTPLVDPRGRVYVGTDAGVVWALGRDGSTRWRLATGAAADTGIVRSPRGTFHFAAGRQVWSVRDDGTVRWRFEADSKVFTTPAIDGDGTLYVGSQDDHLYALAPDGRVRWAYEAGADIDSSPAIGDSGEVYFGSDDGRVHALTPGGERMWATEVGGYARAPVGLGRNGTVLAGVHGPRPRLVCLDAADGRVQWEFPVTRVDSKEVGIASGPVVDRRGAIYFGAHDDYVYALSSQGQLRWVKGVKGDVDPSPVLGPDGTLYVGSDDHHFYAFRDIKGTSGRDGGADAP